MFFDFGQKFINLMYVILNYQKYDNLGFKKGGTHYGTLIRDGLKLIFA